MICLQTWVRARRPCGCDFVLDVVIDTWAGRLHRPSNYTEAVSSHTGTSSPLIWSCGGHRGPVMQQPAWDAGLEWSPLGCVAKTPEQNVRKDKWASKSWACFYPVVRSDLRRRPFSRSHVRGCEWIKQTAQTGGQTQCKRGISIQPDFHKSFKYATDRHRWCLN